VRHVLTWPLPCAYGIALQSPCRQAQNASESQQGRGMLPANFRSVNLMFFSSDRVVAETQGAPRGLTVVRPPHRRPCCPVSRPPDYAGNARRER